MIDSLCAGGAQRQLVMLADGLKKLGHYLEMWTYYPDDFFSAVLHEANITWTIAEKKTRYSLAPVFSLRRKVMNGKFTVVLAFLGTPSIYSELACIGLAHVKVVVSERNCCLNRWFSVGQLLSSITHLLASNVVVNSQSHFNWMVARFPWLRSRMHVIWNGVDTEVFSTSEWVPCRKPLRLIGVGRITPQKNLATLISALALCNATGLYVKVEWAGKTDCDSYQREVLKALEREGAESAWVWLGERRDIPALLQKADALILPSLWEGLPNVICEALSCGLPVLASAVSDNTLLVEHGVRGYTFDPRSAISIARAISKLASLEPHVYLRMRSAARDFALKELTGIQCANSYCELLSEGLYSLKSSPNL